MKNIIIIITIAIAAASCNNLNGKIETRENGKVYLINESKTKELNFTVKKTTITNDSIYDYETQVVPLAAGGEVLIGGNKEIQTTPNYNSQKLFGIYKSVSKTYDIGDYKTFLAKLDSPQKRLIFYNTINKDLDLGTMNDFENCIKNAHDSTAKSIHKFEVVGQSEYKKENAINAKMK